MAYVPFSRLLLPGPWDPWEALSFTSLRQRRLVKPLRPLLHRSHCRRTYNAARSRNPVAGGTVPSTFEQARERRLSVGISSLKIRFFASAKTSNFGIDDAENWCAGATFMQSSPAAIWLR